MLAKIDWNALVTDPLREMLTRIMAYLPVLLGALVIFVIGWLVAKTLKRIVEWLLTTLHFETLAEKSGVSGAMRKGDLKMTVSQIVSGLVYWLIMIMVLVMVVNALGMPKASDILERLFAYIPRVIAAVFVLVVAMFLATFVSGIVRTTAANAKLPHPELLAGICRWAIIVFAVTISLAQLGIAPIFITTTFNILLGGIVLALALAFGLGGKEAAARYLEELKQKRYEK